MSTVSLPEDLQETKDVDDDTATQYATAIAGRSSSRLYSLGVCVGLVLR